MRKTSEPIWIGKTLSIGRSWSWIKCGKAFVEVVDDEELMSCAMATAY
jgi:hypothetical protein